MGITLHAFAALRLYCLFLVSLTGAVALVARANAANVDNEPLNNSRITADSLPLTISGMAISNRAELGGAGGDVDFFQVPLAEGDVLFGMVTPLAALPHDFSRPDTMVGLFHESVGWTFNDDDDAGELPDMGGGYGSVFRFQSPATGVYHIGVSGSGDFAFDGAVSGLSHTESGLYVLTAGRVNPLIAGGGFADNDPANQTAAGADPIPLTPGAAHVAVAQLTDGDVDMFRLELKAGDTLSAMTAPLNDLGVSFDYPDTLLGLFDSSGANLLVANDDAGGFQTIFIRNPETGELEVSPHLASDSPFDGGGVGSALHASITSDGTYFLSVTGFGDDDFAGDHSETGAYALLVGVAVPEPSSAVLAAAAIALWFLRCFVKRNPSVRRKNSGPISACAVASAVATIFVTACSASAAYITIHGGPTYTPGIGGFQVSSGGGDVTGVNDAGTVVGSAYRYDSSGANLALRAVRWDGSGAAAVELGTLGTVFGGSTETQAAAINNAGTVVGKSHLYFGFDLGERAVRWNSSGTAVSMLDQLGPASVRFISEALAINDAGAAVGSAYKVLGMGASFGDYKGTRAVRWSATSTAVTELGNLGTDSSGVTYGSANAINTAGVAVGTAQKFTSGADRGYRAVRWNSGGTAATELGNLGTDPNGSTFSGANAVNDAGTAVGDALKYDASGMYLGSRAVRWNAGGTAATELGHLGTDLSGNTGAGALAINSAGTAIGSASKFDSSGTNLGERAVRWDASGTVATELGYLGTSASGHTTSFPSAINNTGAAVGQVQKYDDFGVLLGDRAVVWGLDGIPVDLNTLIDPASGWTLSAASAISNTGWIGGRGTFDPDGPGGQEPYRRLFLMQVPSAVPEPATVVLFSIALLGLAAALRRHVRRSVITLEN